MKGVTKEEKHRFLKEIDVWNFRITKLYAEFNRTKNELDISTKELSDKNEQLQEADKGFENLKQETLNKKKEKEDYQKALSGGNEVLLDLSAKIDLRTQELEKLKVEIIGQIEANRIREEKELKDLREHITKAISELSTQNQELDAKADANRTLLKANHELEEKIKIKTKEFQEFCEEMDRQRKDIVEQNRGISGREASSGEREKQLNFYNKRIQRMATKLNIQLKEI